MTGSYNLALVAASLIVAIIASYTALTMAVRVTTSSGLAARMWWIGGSFAMGFGIWSMHFIGMLAFDLPIPLGYDLILTAASLAAAVGASVFALWLVCKPKLPWKHLLVGSVLLGTGIVSMHYTGMAALLMDPGISYDPLWFSASVLIAFTASGAALWLTFKLRGNTSYASVLRICAAVVMGCAIVGMHYTGMGAARFDAGSVCRAAGAGVDDRWLAALVIGASLSILGFALLISVYDARLQERTSKLAGSLAAANEQLLHMALHDHLTKLPNRALMHDRIEQAIRKVSRDKGYMSVMLMDLDGFKAINDGFGHHVGDQLLIEVAQRMRHTVRDQDTIARLGGDEFVVLTEIQDKEDAAIVAGKLIVNIEKPYLIAGEELRVSASTGIAICPVDGATPQELLANADAAMYHVKEGGRNGFRFFEHSMNVSSQEQLVLLQHLRRALEQGELRLHYQAKYRAADGSLSGVEALLRWQHPERGLLLPDAFLPAAEKSGLILPIGNWVLREACRQLRAWRDDPSWRDRVPQGWSMAVNISTTQFLHPELRATVEGALLQHGLLPRWLTLEVSESAVLHDEDRSLAVLRDLAQLGVTIAVDQFGTGTSSLLYLKQFPARELKISRGFVRQLGESPADAAIVASLVALGKTLGLRVVAEGVETLAQQAMLTAAGCDELQGYRLGRPVPGEDLVVIPASAVLQGVGPQRMLPELLLRASDRSALNGEG